ncbi:MAG: PHB depolymerase family esterase [Planctomycetaceae bacterium]|nr:PHB depolymerase family esterase [Planctomycetaceae bacterium]
MTRQPSQKLRRPFVALLLAIATIPMVAAPSFAQETERVVKTYRARPGILGSVDRKYVVHLPSNYNPAEKLPLVMVLHGCLQQGGGPLPFIDTIELDSKFDEVADRERFIVVYPNHKLDVIRPSVPFCWEWWIDDNIHEGRGEVADLAEIVKEVQHDYQVDPNRIHIAGLSSGGAMTVAALVAYSEIFASGSPTAGMPYSETALNYQTHMYKPVEEIARAMTAEMGPHKRPVPIFIIQSEDDQVVNLHYAENIRDSWGKAFGVDTRQPISPPESGVTEGTPWTRAKYGQGPDGSTVVETLFLNGLMHGWYGGGKGEFAFPSAPNTAQLAWEFFKAHPLNPERAGTPR